MLFVSPSARRAIGTLPLLLAGLANLPQFILPQFILLQFILPPFIAPAAAHEKVPTYRVVYVAPDDVLNLRSGPSPAYSVVGAIPPGGRGVRLVGHCQAWCPVSYNGTSGWVNRAYLAREPASEEPALPERARGYVAVPLPAARKHGRLPSYWQVTGMPEGESLKVHEAPSTTATVVHAFEPQSACIKLAGSCQKPWCQVMFPGLNSDRLGWVNAHNLAPSHRACPN
ncbi:MAG TPA: SH3 domain-containing protein [Hyphomicrobiaceae bacterium]|nr:SH3 domain-containing protein [Hyphomicrobiaceae bacterium]